MLRLLTLTLTLSSGINAAELRSRERRRGDQTEICVVVALKIAARVLDYFCPGAKLVLYDPTPPCGRLPQFQPSLTQLFFRRPP